MIIHRPSAFSASILKDTNRLISSSEDNFGGIRNGSYLKIGDNDFLYSVIKTNSFFYLKDVEILDNKTLKIDSHTGADLQLEDNVKISFKEYELNSILSITNPGINYNEKDILNVTGGELTIDVSEGIGYPTKLIVEKIDDKGSILRLGLKEKGKYLIPPEEKIKLHGGLGDKAEVELEYDVINKRHILERVIKNIVFNQKDDSTILTLDYSLPVGIKEGKLSVEKWEILLSSDYIQNSQLNIEYKLFKDFTEHINLPLVAKNSLSQDLIINQAFNKLDIIIYNLQKEIEELKKSKNP